MDEAKKKPAKQRIVAAALDLFKHRGYENTTILDICDASGITKSTFYYHFDSKDSILGEFIDVANAYIDENFNKLLTTNDYVGQLWNFYVVSARPTADLGVEISTQLMISNLHKDSRYYIPGQFKEWETEKLLIEKAQENRQILNTASPEKIAECIVYAMEGVTLVWCIQKGNYDLIDKLWEVFTTILVINPEYPRDT